MTRKIINGIVFNKVTSHEESTTVRFGMVIVIVIFFVLVKTKIRAMILRIIIIIIIIIPYLYVAHQVLEHSRLFQPTAACQ